MIRPWRRTTPIAAVSGKFPRPRDNDGGEVLVEHDGGRGPGIDNNGGRYWQCRQHNRRRGGLAHLICVACGRLRRGASPLIAVAAKLS